MGKKKGLFLPALAALVVLVVGFALVVYMPTPEERALRAYDELFQIKIKSIHWKDIKPSKAVEEINEEIQKVSPTRCRLIFAEGANDAVLSYELKLDDTPVTELARYLTELTDNKMYQSPKGIIIDQTQREGYFDGRAFYERPSWRKDVRDWVRYGLLWRLRRLCGYPDPVVPCCSPGPGPMADPFGAPPAPAVPGPSPAPAPTFSDPFAPVPGR